MQRWADTGVVEVDASKQGSCIAYGNSTVLRIETDERPKRDPKEGASIIATGS